MLDDFQYFFNLMAKGMFRSNQKQLELLQETSQVDIRISTRRAAFSLFISSLVFLPMFIFAMFDLFYPSQRSWWNWAYWRYFVLFSFVVYMVAVIVSPRLKRAKTAYILRAVFDSPFFIFLIIFGQIIALGVLPPEFLPWYILIHLPVLVYSPIMFRKKYSNLRIQIKSSKIIWKLKKRPIWDDLENLPQRTDYGLYGQIGCFVPIIVYIFITFLLNFYKFTDFHVGDTIRLGIGSSVIILLYVEIVYRAIIIYYILSELEWEIEQPILLENLNPIAEK